MMIADLDDRDSVSDTLRSVMNNIRWGCYRNLSNTDHHITIQINTTFAFADEVGKSLRVMIVQEHQHAD